VLERASGRRRKFRRLGDAEVAAILSDGAPSTAPVAEADAVDETPPSPNGSDPTGG
jgi:hypothetical protein